MKSHARLVIPGHPHHVLTRGNNRRRLFSYPPEYRRFLHHVRGALGATGCALHAVTLMTHHAHLILTPPDERALAACVSWFSQRYAQERNARRDDSGKLFHERYVCVPILTDEQLGVTTVYTDLNAFRAGKVTDPLEHPWSTFAIHAGLPERARVPGDLWTPSSWYLALGETEARRQEAYRELARAHLAERREPASVKRVEAIEALSAHRYTQRLERPDRTRAEEPRGRYGKIARDVGNGS